MSEWKRVVEVMGKVGLLVCRPSLQSFPALARRPVQLPESHMTSSIHISFFWIFDYFAWVNIQHWKTDSDHWGLTVSTQIGQILVQKLREKLPGYLWGILRIRGWRQTNRQSNRRPMEARRSTAVSFRVALIFCLIEASVAGKLSSGRRDTEYAALFVNQANLWIFGPYGLFNSDMLAYC